MSEADATKQGQDLSQTEDQWQDQVLADAIGYTRGLVAVLDSLTQGFRRRGRELEEHKQHLAILQTERRAVLDERAGLETQLRSLATERDALRTDLDGRNRDLDRLRQELTAARETLEANARELQQLQAALATSTRQAEEFPIIRKERRAALDEVARLEANFHSLTTERDLLRSILQDTEKEREKLQQEHAEAQAKVESNARELQQLQAALATSTRQAEELRQIVRQLERDNESKAQHLMRLGETQRELLQAREAAALARDEHVVLRESLTRTEHLLDTARKQLFTSQQVMERLKASLDEERTLTASLQEQLQSHRQDLSRLGTVARTVSTILTEIAGLVGMPVDMAEGAQVPDRAAAELQGLVQAVRGQAETATETQKEIAVLTSLVESIREILGTTEALPDRLGEVMAERQSLEGRLQEFGLERQRLQEEVAESGRREQQAREEAQRLSEQVNALRAALEAGHAATVRLQPAPAAVPEPRTDSATPQATQPAQMAEAAPDAQPAVEAGAGEPQRPSAAFSVECKVEGAGEDTPDLLQGQPSRINEVGMVIAFDKCLPAGRVVIARLTRRGEEFSLPGSVVRTQPSKAIAGMPASFDHLIRFEHPNLESSRRLKAFLT